MSTPQPDGPQALPPDVSWVRLLWCDNAGIIRAKAFHSAMAATHAEHGIGISVAQQAVHAIADVPASGSGLSPVGEVWLRPDWTTLTALPYAPGHARLFTDIVDGSGEPWGLCPRTFLRGAIDALAAAGFGLQAAFEQEFTLLQRTEAGLAPVDHALFATTSAMDSSVAVINHITEALLAQGIQPACYYAESGPGQHEISILHTDPLAAADRQIALRETVRGVAAGHGLVASFLPKIFAGQAGNGCHLHLSLWRDGENVTGAGGQSRTDISEPMRWFVGGILEHLPALMAITAASPNSYRRLQPKSWAGAFRCWGPDNREAAIRVPGNPAPPSPTHIELKTADATGNPYLTLGAVIHAGLDGINRRLEPGEPLDCDPATLTDAERNARGIDWLPEDLSAAITALEADRMLLDALGEPLARAFLAVRRAEVEGLRDASLEQEVAALAERY